MKPNSERYADALEACADAAKREFAGLFARLDAARPVECKAALLAAVPAIVEKWGGVAALAAAEFYAAEREAAVGGGYRAALAAPVDRGAVEAKVRYALRYLFGEGDGEN